MKIMDDMIQKEKTNVLVTFVVPVFDNEGSLERCVNSLLRQTYCNIEIILVDDGSTDGSRAIIDHYAFLDSRVRVVRQENQGVSKARNLGLEHAHGEWVTFVDSDDAVSDDYIEKLLPEDEEDQMSLCGLTRVYSDGRRNKWNLYHSGSKDMVDSQRLSIQEVMTMINPYALTGPVCKLFKTSIIRENHLFFPVDMSFGEDSVFVFSYLMYVQKVKVVNLWLYDYSFVENSLSQKAKSGDRMLVANRVFRLSHSICEKNHISEDLAEHHYVDQLLQVISSEADQRIRFICYSQIASLGNSKAIKNLLPFYFRFFAKLKRWNLYERLISMHSRFKKIKSNKHILL